MNDLDGHVNAWMLNMAVEGRTSNCIEQDTSNNYVCKFQVASLDLVKGMRMWLGLRTGFVA